MGIGKVPGKRKDRRPWPLEIKLEIGRSVVERGASVPEAAKAAGAIESTVYAWVARYRKRGAAGFAERAPAEVVPRPDPVAEMLTPVILETKKPFGWFGIPRRGRSPKTATEIVPGTTPEE